MFLFGKQSIVPEYILTSGVSHGCQKCYQFFCCCCSEKCSTVLIKSSAHSWKFSPRIKKGLASKLGIQDQERRPLLRQYEKCTYCGCLFPKTFINFFSAEVLSKIALSKNQNWIMWFEHRIAYSFCYRMGY